MNINLGFYYTLRKRNDQWDFNVLPSFTISRKDMLEDEKWFYIIIAWLAWQVQIGIIKPKKVENDYEDW